MRLLMTALLLSLSFGYLHAQETGVVKFLVEVDNGYFEIEVNDTLLLRRYKDTLPAGDYTAKVWSPGYVVTPIDFTVVPGMVTEKHVKMAKNNNYIDYEHNYREYRMQFHKQFTAPLSLTLATALTTGAFMASAYVNKNKALTDIDLYNKAGSYSDVLDLKTSVAEYNRKYNRQRAAFYVGTGLTMAFIGGTIWSYRNFVRNYSEPTFIKESPFKDKYSLNLTPYGCSFTINI